jgi:hypothetical protein
MGVLVAALLLVLVMGALVAALSPEVVLVREGIFWLRWCDLVWSRVRLLVVCSGVSMGDER